MDFHNNKLILAPLAGITERVFRRLCRERGADIVVSEMVSAEGICRNPARNRHYIEFSTTERPIGIQLFGANPRSLADAVRYVEDEAHPDFIDLNSGCPVPKVVRKNGGSALLRDARLFERIVSAMTRAATVPITVKLRSAWSGTDWVDTTFARIAQECGAAAVALHPRTRAMGFSGHSFWGRIAEVKAAVSVPVIGNGDIIHPNDALEMLEVTGCDSLMIGRAARGNPWLFGQIRRRLKGEPIQTVTAQMRYETMLEHITSYRREHGEARAVRELRSQIGWYLKGTPHAAVARERLFSAADTAQIEDAVEEHFRSAPNLTKKPQRQNTSSFSQEH
ncbi:MAG: tRNA dihydrouridine synthase DusB [Chitinivibrionales bacterium]|nr:tRNA dihydrouridine synthase DusB [Chitinivibrionales bacterium]MBD3356048.1 tRNA dihydrouridine synthase DusB [Chitinivibrionales bacterium]